MNSQEIVKGAIARIKGGGEFREMDRLVQEYVEHSGSSEALAAAIRKNSEHIQAVSICELAGPLLMAAEAIYLSQKTSGAFTLSPDACLSLAIAACGSERP